MQREGAELAIADHNLELSRLFAAPAHADLAKLKAVHTHRKVEPLDCGYCTQRPPPGSEQFRQLGSEPPAGEAANPTSTLGSATPAIPWRSVQMASRNS